MAPPAIRRHEVLITRISTPARFRADVTLGLWDWRLFGRATGTPSGTTENRISRCLTTPCVSNPVQLTLRLCNQRVGGSNSRVATKEKPSVLPRVFCYEAGRRKRRDIPRISSMLLSGTVLRFGRLRLVGGQDWCRNARILRFSRPENQPG